MRAPKRPDCVLNDNEMSIAQNVGALSGYQARLVRIPCTPGVRKNWNANAQNTGGHSSSCLGLRLRQPEIPGGTE